MSQMKLGWWMARNGAERKVDVNNRSGRWPWFSSTLQVSWDQNGFWDVGGKPSEHDLIEFIRPLEDLPPTLNSAVKAAEDRVLDLKKHYSAAQDVAEEARRMWEEAKRELERLEKECEVGK